MDEQIKKRCNEKRRIELETKREKLIDWIEKKINECEHKIDKGEPFDWFEARKNAFEEVLEKLY